MIFEIRAPEADGEVAEATILTWKKQDGGRVRSGEVLCEIEFGKTTVELSSDASGILTIIVGRGTMIPAGELIGTIRSDG